MTHINKICDQLFSTVWDIQHIRSRLDFERTKILVQALVLTKLNYCNSLFAGTAKYQLDKMQRVQNTTCHITCNLAKFDHIRTCMADLHWLCIPQRIDYKIACLVYKLQHGCTPQYLQELLPSKQSNRTLRSSFTNQISPVYCRTSQAMHSSFSVVGPWIWNSLPSHIRLKDTFDIFKKALKTHLFKVSYY